MSTDLTQISVETLKGVGKALKQKLAHLGIENIQDLLFHLPFRYEDRTRVTPIGACQPGESYVVEGEVIGIPIPKSEDLRAVPDPWKLLEERNLVSSHSCLQFGTGRTKYGATTPPFASSMIYYTVHACEPHFECFSKIDLKGHSTTLKIVEPKRTNSLQ